MLTANEIRKLTQHRLPYFDETRDGARIVIDPWNPEQLNPNSYDLTLSNVLKTYTDEQLDVRIQPHHTSIAIPVGGLILKPGVLYLGCSKEYTESHGLIPMINGKSSLARLGISVHQTGGFGDIGFCGNWTLEITVVTPIRIFPSMRFAQLCWFRPDGCIDLRYNGRYQHSRSTSPVVSRMFKDWSDEGGRE
jgi:dCTP deaminase